MVDQEQLELPLGDRKPRLIGLYSPAPQSGKSTVASHLVLKHGYHKLRFAGALKMMTSALLASMGVPRNTIDRMIEGDLKEEPIDLATFCPTVTPRKLMQTLGTEWGRGAVYNDFWIDIVRKSVREHLDKGYNVVIDDMRFPNELSFISELGGMCVCIERPTTNVRTTHASEGLLNGAHFDVLLRNNGTVEQLLRYVDVFIDRTVSESSH